MTSKELLKKREQFWKDFDLYDEAHAPECKQTHVTYFVTPPFEAIGAVKDGRFQPYRIHLDVYVSDDLASLGNQTYWFGKRVADMTYFETKEIWDFLVEWELVEYRKIGPEDSEYFATGKLTGEGA